MTPMTHQRLLLRTALHLERHYRLLRRPSQKLNVPSLPCDRWDRIVRSQRQLALAVRHRYSAAASQFKGQLQADLRHIARECQYQADNLELQFEPPKVPPLRLLYEELQFLFDEFQEVRIEWKEKAVSVLTERIVLDDVDLGPFQIRLRLNNLGAHHPYDVVAQDPDKPACNQDITHPHVQGETLCEGDGRHAIAKALQQGRIGEFFLLVGQILRTYNPSSAYLRLSDWSGIPCSGCGNAVADDEESECHRCGSSLCDGCTHCCSGCDESVCANCSIRCDACECRTCEYCLSRCEHCEDSICSGCVTNDLCPTCHQAALENDDEETEDAILEPPSVAASPPQTISSTANDSIQPDLLGEVTISA